jgi:hypothetical protein
MLKPRLFILPAQFWFLPAQSASKRCLLAAVAEAVVEVTVAAAADLAVQTLLKFRLQGSLYWSRLVPVVLAV